MPNKERIQTKVTEMKTLTSHINEALKIGNNLAKFSTYSCRPANKEELQEIIKDRVSKEGFNCDLNDIDTSLITDMSELFADSKFNGNISNWDVSNVTNMRNMFVFSKFNQDISNWNIRPDCSTKYMFLDCPIRKEFKPKLPK